VLEVVPDDVVTTSCGEFAAASRLANLTRAARSVVTTSPTVPFPCTAGVTSMAAVVLTTRPLVLPACVPTGGAVLQLRLDSVHPVPADETVTPFAHVEYE